MYFVLHYLHTLDNNFLKTAYLIILAHILVWTGQKCHLTVNINIVLGIKMKHNNNRNETSFLSHDFFPVVNCIIH